VNGLGSSWNTRLRRTMLLGDAIFDSQPRRTRRELLPPPVAWTSVRVGGERMQNSVPSDVRELGLILEELELQRREVDAVREVGEVRERDLVAREVPLLGQDRLVARELGLERRRSACRASARRPAGTRSPTRTGRSSRSRSTRPGRRARPCARRPSGGAATGLWRRCTARWRGTRTGRSRRPPAVTSQLRGSRAGG
jgi:hypothetical protein